MNNKQHEFILKAFIESRIPCEVKNNAPELILLDSILGGYCTQLIEKETTLNIHTPIISKKEKKTFCFLINNAINDKRDRGRFYVLTVVLIIAELFPTVLRFRRQYPGRQGTVLCVDD